MRIRGRTLRPSTLAERRTMISLFGTATIRVPRRSNPYVVSRRIARVARGTADSDWLKQAVASSEPVEHSAQPVPKPPKPAPDGDTSELMLLCGIPEPEPALDVAAASG